MITTLEQFEQAEKAIAAIKQFLITARRTHSPEAYATLSTPILRELQEREHDMLLYLSPIPPFVVGTESGHGE